MVSEIRIYFEGKKELRSGFHDFLIEIIDQARAKRIRFDLIAGEGAAVRDFMKALRTHKEAANILLIDSEGPDEGNLFDRLKKRKDWTPPKDSHIDESQVLWMVQCMEAWFLADTDALQAYYGQDFIQGKLPGERNVEKIDKDLVLSSLKEAARNTKKKRYHKTRHAPYLLARIDPEKVKKAHHCRRAFNNLSRIVSE